MLEQTSKIVQKRIYDFIGTRFGQSIVVIGAFVIAWKFISIISTVVTSGKPPFAGCDHQMMMVYGYWCC
jgi:Na+/proline symporter